MWVPWKGVEYGRKLFSLLWVSTWMKGNLDPASGLQTLPRSEERMTASGQGSGVTRNVLDLDHARLPVRAACLGFISCPWCFQVLTAGSMISWPNAAWAGEGFASDPALPAGLAASCFPRPDWGLASWEESGLCYRFLTWGRTLLVLKAAGL